MKRTYFLYILIIFIFLSCNYGFSQEEYYNLAVENYVQGNFELAAKNIEKAVALNPQNSQYNDLLVEILISASKFYYSKKEYSKAIPFLKKAVELTDDKNIKEMYQISVKKTSPTEKPKMKKTEPDKNTLINNEGLISTSTSVKNQVIKDEYVSVSTPVVMSLENKSFQKSYIFYGITGGLVLIGILTITFYLIKIGTKEKEIITKTNEIVKGEENMRDYFEEKFKNEEKKLTKQFFDKLKSDEDKIKLEIESLKLSKDRERIKIEREIYGLKEKIKTDSITKKTQDNVMVVNKSTDEKSHVENETKIKKIKKLLRDNDKWVRVSVANRIADMDFKDIGDIIRELLNDPEEEVREAAMVSLEKIKNRV